jgi:hypothetical protein
VPEHQPARLKLDAVLPVRKHRRDQVVDGALHSTSMQDFGRTEIGDRPPVAGRAFRADERHRPQAAEYRLQFSDRRCIGALGLPGHGDVGVSHDRAEVRAEDAGRRSPAWFCQNSSAKTCSNGVPAGSTAPCKFPKLHADAQMSFSRPLASGRIGSGADIGNNGLPSAGAGWSMSFEACAISRGLSFGSIVVTPPRSARPA